MLATTYRRSNQILAMRNSYHGRSFSTVGITGNRGWSPTSLSPLQTLYVHGGVRTRGPYADLNDAEFIAACVDDLKDLLGHVRPPAALIAEPVQARVPASTFATCERSQGICLPNASCVSNAASR
jgi:4-aminobutyrate aminotransferase